MRRSHHLSSNVYFKRSCPRRPLARICDIAVVATVGFSVQEARADRPRFVAGKKEHSPAVDSQASHLLVWGEVYSTSVDYTNDISRVSNCDLAEKQGPLPPVIY